MVLYYPVCLDDQNQAFSTCQDIGRTVCWGTIYTQNILTFHSLAMDFAKTKADV